MFTHRHCFLAAVLLITPSVGVNAADAPASYRQIAGVNLPGAEGWDYLTVDSVIRRLYISRQTHVVAIDIDKNTVAGDITGLGGVHGIAIDDADGLGFISDGKASSVVTFDLKTLTKLRETPAGKRADGIVFDPLTRRVFAFNATDQTATVVDAKSGSILGTIALPGKPEFPATDAAGHVYDNIEDKSEVVSINAKTLKVEAVWPVAPGEGPSGLAMDTKTHRLFSTCGNKQLVVMDASTGKVVATPAIGNGPDAVVFDATTHMIFVPAGRDGVITIIREASADRYETVATIATQPGARTIALDTKTHRVYTVAAQRAPTAPGEAPAPHGVRYVDGTFNVLIYGPAK